MKPIPLFATAALCVFALGNISSALAEGSTPRTIELHDGWKIQAAAKIAEKSDVVSSAGFDATGWYNATAPSTVLAALVDNGVYKNIYFDTTLGKIPAKQFEGAWWYRCEFTVPQAASFIDARLIFEGINYRADIFFNGKKVADHASTFGAFRMFEIDVSAGLHKGANVLAVKVFPPKPGDFTLGFVDWNPTPPDHGMGLFRPVRLKLSGPISVDAPYIQSKIDTKTLAEASVTVSAVVTNRTDKNINGTVKGTISGINFGQDFALRPHESRDVTFSPQRYQQLVIKNPKLWWPACLGKPELHKLDMAVSCGADLSDSQSVMVGIRQVEDYVNERGYRGYAVNGRRLLIKGGGWADELLLRESDQNLDAQMRYTLHMNLNTIRLEGVWGSSRKMYDLADKYGILLMVGWSCQWEWPEYIGKPMPDTVHGMAKTPTEMILMQRYFHDQILWLRHHPSLFVFAIGSDKLLFPEMEKRFRKDIVSLDPALPLLASCGGWKSEVSGNTAVKMKGPYDYVTPNYWYLDTARGGAFGFNTETGPGPQPPVVETLKKMLPRDKLWPVNASWNYHCGRNEFKSLDRYLLAFDNRYGKATSAEDFCFRAQAVSYEAMRPMFEAFAINRSITTGIIQWMHNASWPKFYWQLYDYYLVPTGAFYGAKKACEPLTLAYDYGDKSVYLVNQTGEPRKGMRAVVRIFDADSKPALSKTVSGDVSADASVKLIEAPPPSGITPVYFLALALSDNAGRAVSDNFYWLSVKQDKPQLNRTGEDAWVYTPCTEWADFTGLGKLPSVAIKATSGVTVAGDTQTLTATLTNPSQSIAFFIELKVLGDKSGKIITPVFWSDNYVSLLPGESKTFSASFATADVGSEKPVFRYRGWNVADDMQGNVSKEGAGK